MGPDQGKPGTTEDVLLPRLNDARGHAANILAPGGTIWRMDHEGKNMSLVAAGFRNHFDAAFSPNGELFTFDSDMEWDEGLPWYRAVRVCHCPPGADFVWRTGSANTPDYYIDSLPPIYETGRGSPVGLEFYDHAAFPEKYRGAFFMADWSLGIIYAAHLKRDGASYKAEVEKFCVGAPMNVTDIAVGLDGALYFCLGGRGTQGGVYRIAHSKPAEPKGEGGFVGVVLSAPQPLSAWSHERRLPVFAELLHRSPAEILGDAIRDAARPASERVKLLNYIQKNDLLHALQGQGALGGRKEVLGTKFLVSLCVDKSEEVRAQAVWMLGIDGAKEGRETLVKALERTKAPSSAVGPARR
jgi:hypothetical protein